jgi:hypothetical protein
MVGSMQKSSPRQPLSTHRGAEKSERGEFFVATTAFHDLSQQSLRAAAIKCNSTGTCALS